jgi:hypothetical protein
MGNMHLLPDGAISLGDDGESLTKGNNKAKR